MITVKLFAILKDRAGTDELRVAPGPGTVADLLRQVAKDHPALAEVVTSGRLLVSVNREFARQADPVRDGDEVALMPPFSGGIAEPRINTNKHERNHRRNK